jgi:hypothetical protein
VAKLTGNGPARPARAPHNAPDSRRRPESYDRDTDLGRFVFDLKTGTTAAGAHVKYIQTLSARAQEVGKELDRVRKIAQWCGAMQQFAVASRSMDPADIASVKEWISTIKTLWNATAPFLEWVNNKSWLAASGGS